MASITSIELAKYLTIQEDLEEIQERLKDILNIDNHNNNALKRKIKRFIKEIESFNKSLSTRWTK